MAVRTDPDQYSGLDPDALVVSCAGCRQLLLTDPEDKAGPAYKDTPEKPPVRYGSIFLGNRRMPLCKRCYARRAG